MSLAIWAEQLQIVTTYALVGVIWIVQLVVYPSFLHSDPKHWVALHRRHCENIGWIVIPLMLTEMACGWLLLMHPTPAVERIQLPLFSCVALAWLSTGLIQVPLHERLRHGFDERLIRRLVRSNALRTAAWTIKGLLLFASLD